MTHAPGREQPRQHGWPVGRAPFDSPAGLRFIVPGWPQFFWGQRERGWVLFGSFVVAFGAGILTWGTWVAWSFFAFAFLTHITSMTDSIRQGSFPVYPRRTALLMISGTLAVSCYLPLLSALFFTACPEFSPDRTGSVYLVNCLAYRATQPRCGHWVWLRAPSVGQVHSARVVAVAGQEVEWNGRHWLIDGKDQPLNELHRNTVWPLPCRFKIAADQLLVEPEEEEFNLFHGEPALPGRSRAGHGSRLGPLLPRLGSTTALSEFGAVAGGHPARPVLDVARHPGDSGGLAGGFDIPGLNRRSRGCPVGESTTGRDREIFPHPSSVRPIWPSARTSHCGKMYPSATIESCGDPVGRPRPFRGSDSILGTCVGGDREPIGFVGRVSAGVRQRC